MMTDTTATEWYVDDLDGPAGPFSTAAIKAMASSGRLARGTMISRSRDGGWKPVSAFPSLAALVGTAAAASRPTSRPPMTRPERHRYAGFWIRFVAYTIDSLVVGIPLYMLAGIVVGMLSSVLVVPGQEMEAGAALIVIGLLLFITCGGTWFYFAYMHAGRWQATLGKRMLGIHVIAKDGTRISMSQSTMRHLAFGIASIPLCIGLLLVAFTEQKVGLHDMLCGTRVVHGKK